MEAHSFTFISDAAELNGEWPACVFHMKCWRARFAKTVKWTIGFQRANESTTKQRWPGHRCCCWLISFQSIWFYDRFCSVHTASPIQMLFVAAYARSSHSYFCLVICIHINHFIVVRCYRFSVILNRICLHFRYLETTDRNVSTSLFCQQLPFVLHFHAVLFKCRLCDKHFKCAFSWRTAQNDWGCDVTHYNQVAPHLTGIVAHAFSFICPFIRCNLFEYRVFLCRIPASCVSELSSVVLFSKSACKNITFIKQ